MSLCYKCEVGMDHAFHDNGVATGWLSDEMRGIIWYDRDRYRLEDPSRVRSQDAT